MKQKSLGGKKHKIYKLLNFMKRKSFSSKVNALQILCSPLVVICGSLPFPYMALTSTEITHLN